MKKVDLHIWVTGEPGEPFEGEMIPLRQFVRDVRSLRVLKKFRGYRDVVVHCRSYHRLPRTFCFLMIAKWMSSRNCVLVNAKGKRKSVDAKYLLRSFGRFLSELLSYHRYIKGIEKHIKELKNAPYTPVLVKDGIPFYLISDYSPYSLVAGGSLGHIAGVVNNLGDAFDSTVCFVSSDSIPMVSPSVEQHFIDENDDLKYTNISDIARLYYNEICERCLNKLSERWKPMFLYQRSTLNAYAGVEFAIRNNVPYVLEYNSSGVWARLNWDHSAFIGEQLSREIERFSLEKASLIVCVSHPLRKQLVGWGIDPAKIMVVPNGVDTDVYTPLIDGFPIREQLRIPREDIVVGFIGTFGLWHGADILAKAAVEVLKVKTGVTFLFVGDGLMLSAVKDILKESQAMENCRFTGLVPQSEGKNYMAACDILASPQVPNKDGSPFFGSPTKLFEYMAMGKAIVVTGMEQMAEVCEDNVTALLSRPGDAEDLADKIMRLCGDGELRARLGENARREVCARYTWKLQTKKIADGIRERFA